GKFSLGLFVHEPELVFKGSIENYFNVGIPCLPWILEKFLGFGLIARGDRITQPIEGLPQRRPPLLVPARVASRVAPTITLPTFDTVPATPGAIADDLGLMDRRMLLQEFSVVREAGDFAGFDVVQSEGESHIAVSPVMAVGLAIGGDVNQLGPGTRIRECSDKSVGETLTV